MELNLMVWHFPCTEEDHPAILFPWQMRFLRIQPCVIWIMSMLRRHFLSPDIRLLWIRQLHPWDSRHTIMHRQMVSTTGCLIICRQHLIHQMLTGRPEVFITGRSMRSRHLESVLRQELPVISAAVSCLIMAIPASGKWEVRKTEKSVT